MQAEVRGGRCTLLSGLRRGGPGPLPPNSTIGLMRQIGCSSGMKESGVTASSMLA